MRSSWRDSAGSFRPLMFGAGDCESTGRGRWPSEQPWSFRPLMFGAGDCERRRGASSWMTASTRRFRPLMFGAGDCEPEISEWRCAWPTRRFRPLMFGAGDCEAALVAVKSGKWSVLTVFQTPHVRGRGLRGRRTADPCRNCERTTSFRPLMFGAGDCEGHWNHYWVLRANVGKFQTPHVRGRGLRAPRAADDFFTDPEGRFRPLRFGAGDCEDTVTVTGAARVAAGVSDPSCSGQGTASSPRWRSPTSPAT